MLSAVIWRAYKDGIPFKLHNYIVTLPPMSKDSPIK